MNIQPSTGLALSYANYPLKNKVNESTEFKLNQQLQSDEQNKESLSLEKVDDCKIMPPALVTPQSIDIAANYGVACGLESLRKLHENNPALEASAALEIMESLYKIGFSAKVDMFVRFNGATLANQLKDTQKAEFCVRVAKFMTKEDKVIWRDQAEKLITRVEEICTPKTLIDLAILFAKALDKEKTIYWLNRAQSGKEHCEAAAEHFFKESLFEEGLCVLDSLKRFSNELGIADPKAHDQPDKSNFIEFLAYCLRNREMIESEKDLEFFLFQEDFQRNVIVIKALIYLGKSDLALGFARQMSLSKQNIYYMLEFNEYARKKSNVNYLKIIRELCLKLQNKLEAIRSVCMSKQFSLQEDIETCSLLKFPYEEIPILWKRTCEMTLSSDRIDLDGLRLILEAIRIRLMQFSKNDLKCDPSYWVNILEAYIKFGFHDEALKTGEEWKKWLSSLSSKPIRIKSDVSFLSCFGIFEIAIGHKTEGLTDLRQAYKMQKNDWEHFPDNANNFAFFILNGIDEISRLKIAFPESTVNKIQNIPLEEFNDQRLAEIFK